MSTSIDNLVREEDLKMRVKNLHNQIKIHSRSKIIHMSLASKAIFLLGS